MRRRRFVQLDEWLGTPNGGCFARRKGTEMSGEERLTRLQTGGWPRPLHNSEKTSALTGRNIAEIVELLECKLAGFGFRSVKVGPFIRVKDGTVSIDLMDRGDVLCRIELEYGSGEWDDLDLIQRSI